MLCFYPAKLVVLAVPKTGTTALEETLGAHADLHMGVVGQGKHMTYRDFIEKLAPQVRQSCGGPVEIWAVMREPLEWLGSWYRFRRRHGVSDPHNSTRGVSFDTFVRTFCSDARPPWADLQPQSHFLTTDAGGIGPDRIFRHADHHAFPQALGARLGQPVDLPRRNVSPDGNLDLSAGTEAILRDRCARDFALYASLPQASV
jgi:hypothetical protein